MNRKRHDASTETTSDSGVNGLHFLGDQEEQFFDGHGGLVWSRRWNAAGDLVEDTSFTARTT